MLNSDLHADGMHFCDEQVGRAGSAPCADSRHRNEEAEGSDL